MTEEGDDAFWFVFDRRTKQTTEYPSRAAAIKAIRELNAKSR